MWRKWVHRQLLKFQIQILFWTGASFVEKFLPNALTIKPISCHLFIIACPRTLVPRFVSDINDCDPNPCEEFRNSVGCEDEDNGYFCICALGWTGHTCDDCKSALSGMTLWCIEHNANLYEDPHFILNVYCTSIHQSRSRIVVLVSLFCLSSCHSWMAIREALHESAGSLSEVTSFLMTL